MGFTLEKLSSMVGCSKPYLSTIERGKVSPPTDELLAKLESALEFDKDSLVEMACIERMPHRIREDIESCKLENVRLKSLIRDMSKQKELNSMLAGNDELSSMDGFVPVINRVAAGYPVDFDDLGYPVGFADDYIKCPDLADANAFAVRIVGESMRPDYSEGDIVVFSPSRTVDNGDDCFVRFTEPHETTFKRVYFQLDGTVLLQPRNPNHSPFIIDSERINGVYKAVRRYQTV